MCFFIVRLLLCMLSQWLLLSVLVFCVLMLALLSFCPNLLINSVCTSKRWLAYTLCELLLCMLWHSLLAMLMLWHSMLVWRATCSGHSGHFGLAQRTLLLCTLLAMLRLLASVLLWVLFMWNVADVRLVVTGSWFSACDTTNLL